MRIALRCTLSLLCFALAFTGLNGAFAQNTEEAANDALPGNYLGGMHVKHAKSNAGGLHGKGNIPTPHGFPAGIDTIANFTDHFEAQGVFYDGTPHHIW